MMEKLTVGIAQIQSVHLDLPETLRKLATIVADAAAKKVNLLVFGESWLGGYPAWVDVCPNVGKWDNEPMKTVFQKFYNSSITVPGPEAAQISNLASENGMMICIGVNERVESGGGNGTVYNSVLLFGSDGTLLNHHRKLVPTFTEKLLYGLGDGEGLRPAKSRYGYITASICWEHWMPLLRQTLHNSGEHIHIALWPTVHEIHQLASRQYAFEGRCFVIAAGQLMKPSEFPDGLELPAEYEANPDQWVMRGGSCIIGPKGNFLTEPAFEKEELIVYQIDPAQTIGERMTLDTTGHYQRNDIFELTVNRVRYN